MFCNTALAEKKKINCTINWDKLKDFHILDYARFKGKTIKLLVDTDKMKIYNNSDNSELAVFHGVENEVDIKDGISSYAIIPINNSTEKEFDIKLVEVAKKEKKKNTPEEILLEYKKKFFKPDESEDYRTVVLSKKYKGFEKGTQIAFGDTKNFSERVFFKMPLDKWRQRELKQLEEEYKETIASAKAEDWAIERKKLLGTEKDEKKETENFYGKIFNYFSTLKLKSELDQDVYYAYRVHVYWGGVSFNEKKKAELEKIINDKKSTLSEKTNAQLKLSNLPKDFPNEGMVIEIVDSRGYENKNLKHPFYGYVQSDYPFSYQFKFNNTRTQNCY